MFEFIQDEGLRLYIRRKYISATKWYRKSKLTNKNFTIVSNNCWGGIVYQSYGLQYQSPFIGLFIMPDHYIKLLTDFKYYMAQQLEFNTQKPSSNNYLDNKPAYPIGKLGGEIEIHFLHYHSKEEAIEKWNKRLERINWDKILFKFNDQNGCTKEHINSFINLPLPNKICFSTKNYNNPKVIWIKGSKGQQYIPTSFEPIGASRFININTLLNNL